MTRDLNPLAEFIIEQNIDSDPESEAEKYINSEKEIETADAALQGAMDIIAEDISDMRNSERKSEHFMKKRQK